MEDKMKKRAVNGLSETETIKKVLLVAQTPPPFHGQAIMQQFLVSANWTWCLKDHVRMDYSENIAQIGSFRFEKIAKLLKVLYGIWRSSRRRSIDVLYYPPAGPNRIPLYRDIITLFFAKIFCKRIVLHFHAGGLSELIGRLNPVERFFAKAAFKNIDTAIVLLPWLRQEVAWFAPRRTVVVPNGIEDVVGSATINRNLADETSKILFVGNLKDEKGIIVLLNAVARLKAIQLQFQLRVMGEAHGASMQEKIEILIKERGLANDVVLLGSLNGEKKWHEFKQATIFCLPTFATEAMPVSILEAMMFSLPVVSTNWRGIPDMITNKLEGILVPVKDAKALATGLSELIIDREKAKKMGLNGRKKFESSYSLFQHLSAMEAAFKNC